MHDRFSMRRATARVIPALVALGSLACGGGGKSGGGAAAGSGQAAQAVYVAPGAYDEFYSFMSGGFSGQVSVYGLPSGRMFKVIPVFSQDPEKAYGYSEQTRPMLMTSFGFMPWDDAHHPQLSRVNAEPDGRWLFINGNNTPRIARLDLTEMETREIIEIPNAAGNHASPFVTPNNEYVVGATRFSVPTPQADVPIADYKEKFTGVLSFVKVDSATGAMSLAFQIHMPGYDYDLSRAGKGPSNGVGLLHQLQYRAGQHPARGQRLPERQGLRRRHPLDGGREVRGRRQGQDLARPLRPQLDGRQPHRPLRDQDRGQGARGGRLPERRLLPADAQVAARRGRGSDRRVHRGRGQAGHRHPGIRLLQDPEGDRRQ